MNVLKTVFLHDRFFDQVDQNYLATQMGESITSFNLPLRSTTSCTFNRSYWKLSGTAAIKMQKIGTIIKRQMNVILSQHHWARL